MVRAAGIEPDTFPYIYQSLKSCLKQIDTQTDAQK